MASFMLEKDCMTQPRSTEESAFCEAEPGWMPTVLPERSVTEEMGFLPKRATALSA